MALPHLTVDQVPARPWSRQLSHRPPGVDPVGVVGRPVGVSTQVTPAARAVTVGQPTPRTGATGATLAAETPVRTGRRGAAGCPRVSRRPEPPGSADRLGADTERPSSYPTGAGDA